MASDILSKPFNAYYRFYSSQTHKPNKGIGTYILIFFLFIFYLALAAIHITFLIITVGQLVDPGSATRAIIVMFGGEYRSTKYEMDQRVKYSGSEVTEGVDDTGNPGYNPVGDSYIRL